MKIVPDTTAIIDGMLKGRNDEILVPEAVHQFFEREARLNKATGKIALSELTQLKVKYTGKKLSIGELSRATEMDIDAIARDIAFDEDASLATSSEIQAEAARAKGINVIFSRHEKKQLSLVRYFDTVTMSVHIKEGMRAYAKKGKPGDWKFEPATTEILEQADVEKLARNIIEEAKSRDDGFVEIERPGSTIIQLADFRTVITQPPFSDGWEITAVRPVKKLTLPDYNLSEKLMERVSETAEGILIAGSPGMGKSTFAAALAEYYASKKKIVKTVEAPRDLVLPTSITQYAISHADAQEIHDILLLSRPDYTFFDEMRNTDDFRLFSDLRLAGIGFVGIVHATNPIDAIQRFVGRIELGVIPQVIDTVIFIKNGTVAKALSLKMLVKVPAGMTEADLARPVVVVSDFETRKPEFELYSYGEETVVIPVTDHKKSPALALAQRQVEQILSKYTDQVEVEMLSENKCIVFVPEDLIPKMIGKQGKNIAELEKKIGISIDVRPLVAERDSLPFEAVIMSKSIVFQLSEKFADHDVQIMAGGDYLLTAKVSKKGVIKVKKGNKIGRILEEAINMGEVSLVE